MKIWIILISTWIAAIAANAHALTLKDQQAKDLALKCVFDDKPCREVGDSGLGTWRRMHKAVVPNATPTCDFPTDLKSPKIIMDDAFVKDRMEHNVSLTGSLEQISEGIINACLNGETAKKMIASKIKTIRLALANPPPKQDPQMGPIPVVTMKNGELVIAFYLGSQDVANTVSYFLLNKME